jgi:hypothetical protein
VIDIEESGEEEGGELMVTNDSDAAPEAEVQEKPRVEKKVLTEQE